MNAVAVLLLAGTTMPGSPRAQFAKLIEANLYVKLRHKMQAHGDAHVGHH
ncbi:MAG: hypothetical protein QGH42_07440 [Kiritimatiellia bacterium]|jgi:hypothetical protein|nr:hypothetical protein [Pseudomonadales bacterium]MDP7024056.1 hypothetical protein [Kiritimatiellia bacterium]|tara:strand:- start:19 stop:168 length:150 start_codon:yes stop_codon:yes gene_type:complete